MEETKNAHDTFDALSPVEHIDTKSKHMEPEDGVALCLSGGGFICHCAQTGRSCRARVLHLGLERKPLLRMVVFPASWRHYQCHWFLVVPFGDSILVADLLAGRFAHGVGLSKTSACSQTEKMGNPGGLFGVSGYIRSSGCVELVSFSGFVNLGELLAFDRQFHRGTSDIHRSRSPFGRSTPHTEAARLSAPPLVDVPLCQDPKSRCDEPLPE